MSNRLELSDVENKRGLRLNIHYLRSVSVNRYFDTKTIKIIQWNIPPDRRSWIQGGE